MKDIIDKAVKGGFKWNSIDSDIIDEEIYLISCNTENDGMNDVYIKWGDGNSTIWYFNEIIFSHDFLKAFFGEHQICDFCFKEPETESFNPNKCDCDSQYTNTSWIVHAQQLVLSTDRKKYLKRFI